MGALGSAAGTENGCLHDLIPNATVFVLLVNPNNPSAEIPSKQAAARAIGVPREVQIFPYFLHKNPLQRRRVDIAIDANPTPALQLDLDQPRFLAPPATWGAIDRGRLPSGNQRRQ
jgi:hypothetical protein